MDTNNRRLSPLWMALCVILGIMVGTFYTSHFSGNRLSIVNTSSNKLNHLLQTIDNSYVDTVDMNQLVETAMPMILSELDPHSSYFSAKDAEMASSDLKGSFSGIGISFTIPRDTVTVMRVIAEGPSEKVGLMFGDRIISANGRNLVGMPQDSVMNILRGPKDSKVKLVVVRPGTKKPLRFSVVRGDIPVSSIESSYILSDGVGYIRVKNFGETTYEEFMVALAELNIQGMNGLIVDLRGNRGGYMHIATQMVNEFLAAKKLIVYTQGRKSPREDYRADGRGSFQQLPLTVLVDEGSASASEIFAGAIQDNDRGTIIGRRSFGKGLVQQPMEFKDGSMLRLTIARYYTPSGRCIQKPYVKGHGTDYENELLERYERGEYFNQDSIRQNGNAFKTSIGRTVYDGGGISPDIFIPQDTSMLTSYYQEALFNGHIRQFAFVYCDRNYHTSRRYATLAELEKHLQSQNLLNKFASYAEQNGLKRRNLMLQKSKSLFQQAIFGSIIYNMLDENQYQQFLNQTDPVVQCAFEVLNRGESVPQLEPEKTDELEN